MHWKQILADALKAAREIGTAAKAAGRELTADEMRAFNAHMAKANEARAKIKAIDESEALYKALATLPDGYDILGDGSGSGNGNGAKAGQVLSFKGLARQVKATMRGKERGFGVKALLAEGSVVTTAQTLTSPVAAAKPATGLLDLLSVRLLEGGDQYTYLTHVARTNNAAPVAAGALKPTSVYNLVRKNGKLQVIAHLSEPIPEFWLKDEPALEQFLASEMGYGLQVALENQVLNGDGEEPNLLGLLEVSGIQVQAYNTSQIRTVRSAITRVETMGYTASGLVLHANDWEAIETAADGEDRYFMTPDGSPVDRAARRLWGVPVALTTQIAQGTGALLSDAADGPVARVVADRDVELRLGVVGDDFGRNQVRARFEGRFGVEVLHPSGVVELDLSAV